VPQRAGPVDRVEVELPGLSDYELVTYKLHENSPAAHGTRVPRWARPVLIRRAGSMLNVHNAGHLRSGDQIYLFTAPGQVPLLDKLYGRSRTAIEEEAGLFGDFVIDPQANAAQVGETYGFTLPEESAGLTVAELFRHEYGEVETGDRISLGDIALIARTVERGEVVEVGLMLEPVREPTLHLPKWLSFLR
jgi:cell volume regulation protein A